MAATGATRVPSIGGARLLDNTIRVVRPHDLLETYLALQEARDISPLTLRNYRACCERFLATAAGQSDAAGWDDMTLAVWLQQLRRQGLTDGGVAYHQRHVYAWLRWLRRKRHLPEDITDLVPIVTPREVKRRVLDSADFVRLVAAQGRQRRAPDGRLGDHEHRLRGLAMLHVLRDTGVRRSTLVSLDLADLDQRQRILTVRVTKTRRIGEVYYTPAAKLAIAEYISGERGSQPGALFLDRGGKRLTVAGAVSWLRRLSELAGVECGFHDFRRAAATKWARDGMAYPDIQTLLVQETPAMALLYAASARQDTARDAYRRLYG